MSRRNGDMRPHLRPVTRVELSENNTRLRWILIAVLLIIATVAIGMGFYHALNVESGWNTVTVASGEPNCGSEFVLMYDYSDYGRKASAADKRLTGLYSQASADSFAIFSPDISKEGLGNLFHVNAHVNKAVTVEKPLYEAFALISRYDSRNLYLGPVYREYERVFHSEADVLAAEYDPDYNAEAADYVSQLISFIRDPEMIRLELLADDQVILHVSQEYLDFAAEHEIDQFLDFGWMRNAFLADYIAGILSEAGFTCGYLASYDGYTRNLDTRQEDYSFNIFDMRDGSVYMPARMQYQNPASIVFLRSYPLEEPDVRRCYSYADGSITTSLIDPQDGADKAAAANLVAYSQSTGCAEILMEITPLFVADSFSEAELKVLAGKGIYSVWCREDVVCYNDDSLMLTLMPDDEGKLYSKELMK